MTRGGKRKGAGRPVGSTKLKDKLSENLLVRVTPSQRVKAERIGGGNASEGVRVALDAYRIAVETFRK